MLPVLTVPNLPEAALSELRPHFELRDVSGSSADVVGILGFSPTRELLDGTPRLRAISTISAGYDNFDVEELTRRGILLMNCPDALTETTADLAFTLILAAARRVVELADWMRAGEWTTGLPESHFGVDVHGKTLGIVGLGRIGAAVARRGALGFGMRILYSGPSAKPEAERQLGAERRELDALLEESDFVCLTLPLRPDTDRLIGARQLARMKPSAILVNVARGRVVDEVALIDALRSGAIRGAGLDVFEREPLPMESPLLRMPNVVLLPHIGSATPETRTAMAVAAARHLVSYLVEGVPMSPVNPEAIRR